MSILFGRSQTLTVYSNGHYENGRYIKEAATSSTVTGDIQPITGKELETLTIGQKNLGKIKMYTNTQLNITNEKTTTIGDIVFWNGENYELIGEEIRDNGLIDHYKYIGELRK